MTVAQPWWKDAVIYQIYPRSWADSDGDGIGDLTGITQRLDHLAYLGVDAIWLSPFYVSPQNDAGYDVADYFDVDPLFGDLAAADAMIAKAHELGLKVIVDLVPNHSSSEHEWFRAALAAGPGSPERARYIFRDGKGSDGSEPPNNWVSNFGGPAWTRLDDGDWYLHLFDVTQPDFDWNNPEVGELMIEVLRFWLDRGADGFRVDVAHGLVKADGLPDSPELKATSGFSSDRTSDEPMWDQPGVHDIYRRWRKVVDSYATDGADDDRILCAEAWVTPLEALARYVRPDEMHQSFNFDFLMTPWRAPLLRRTISESLAANEAVGAPTTWVLSNHDVVRHATRLGYPQPERSQNMEGIGASDPQPDAELGLRRARAATTLMLALPGGAYLYQGEELGLPEATQLPDEVRQDPTWVDTGGERRGRDGCRVPMAWERDAPAHGFSPSGASWLPQPHAYGELAVDQQLGVAGSTLELYRQLLQLRRDYGLGNGTLTWTDQQAPNSDQVLSFEVAGTHGRTVSVLANCGPNDQPLPVGVEVIAASDSHTGKRKHVPGDVTVWFVEG